jgi:hypothetical protein
MYPNDEENRNSFYDFTDDYISSMSEETKELLTRYGDNHRRAIKEMKTFLQKMLAEQQAEMKKIFMKNTTNPIKKGTFGTCAFDKEHPLDKATINGETKYFGYTLTLEEAFKHRQAVDECIRHIFAYKQSTTVAKKARVEIAINRVTKRISVHEYPVRR